MDVGLSAWLPGSDLAVIHAVRPQHEMTDRDLAVGGVRYERVEPMRQWRITADADAFVRDLDGRKDPRPTRLRLDLTFHALAPAIGSDGQGRAGAGASAATRQHVGKGHLEQAGRWTGWIEADGRRHDLAEARGNRDKSWGPRRWGGPRMWRWFSINVGDDVHFGGIRIGTDAGDLHRGWVWRDGDAREHPRVGGDDRARAPTASRTARRRARDRASRPHARAPRRPPARRRRRARDRRPAHRPERGPRALDVRGPDRLRHLASTSTSSAPTAARWCRSSERHARDRERTPVPRRAHRHARRQRAPRRDPARHALARRAPTARSRSSPRRGGGPNGAAIGPDGARLRLQQRRLRVARRRRPRRAGQPADGLHRRPHPARRPRDRAASRTSTRSATATRCAGRTTSSSTRPAASGSPTTARSASATATAPASTTRAPTARRSARSSSRSTRRTASASRPTASALYVGRDLHRPRLVRGTSPGRAQVAARRRLRARRRQRCSPACPGFQLFDSLAVDGAGNVCVATLVNGGITVISPDGGSIEHVADGRPDHDQHLLRRAGSAHRLRDALGHRAASWRSTGRGRACVSPTDARYPAAPGAGAA